MRNEPQRRDAVLFCALCGTTHGQLFGCEGGYVCESCAEHTRQGRDTTTQAVRSTQMALGGQADAARAHLRGEVLPEQQAYKTAAAQLMARESMEVVQSPFRGAGGEVLPWAPGELRDTLAAPNAAALDASAHRLALVSQLGNDVAALAMDAADTIGASNSLERMAAQQLATLHHLTMRAAAKAEFEPNPLIAMRSISVAIRGMEVFSQGVERLKAMRTNASDVTVGQVNVAAGGQAIVGNVNTPRRKK